MKQRSHGDLVKVAALGAYRSTFNPGCEDCSCNTCVYKFLMKNIFDIVEKFEIEWTVSSFNLGGQVIYFKSLSDQKLGS